jgi:hypothetical protein
MTRKFALIPASLILAALANTLGATQIAVADAKYIKLIMLNKAKVDIQVFVQDFVGKKSDEQKNAVPTGKDTASKAMRDAKGNVDFFIEVRYVDEKKGSKYRCLAVQTKEPPKDELKYSIDETFGKSVSGAGIGCRP